MFPIVGIIHWTILGLPMAIIFCKILGYETPFPLSGSNVNHSQFYMYKYGCIGIFALCFPLLLSFCVAITLNNSLSLSKFLLIITLISQIFFGCVASIFPDFSSLAVCRDSVVTEYSHRFSYKKFSKVKIGMSRKEVISLIGNGYKYQESNQCLQYSRSSQKDKYYWLIKIEFDKTDVVSNVVCKYKK